MADSLKTNDLSKGVSDISSQAVGALDKLVQAARAQQQGQYQGRALPPVDQWHPDHVGHMDMVIKADGSWWHEGAPINRPELIRLFSTILRKDADGQTYLVTPSEQLAITVEAAHFLIVRMDRRGQGKAQRLFFTTNMGDVIEVGPARPLWMAVDQKTGQARPYVRVRGRLDALLSRPVFYELAEHVVQGPSGQAASMGVYSGGLFYVLDADNSEIAGD